MYRLSQEVSDVVIPIPLIKKDGTQAIGLALGTLSVNIIDPNGAALSSYNPPTYSEPNSDGIYTLKFSRSQLVGAAFTMASKNPYTVTLFSSTANVMPTTIQVWVLSNSWSGILKVKHNVGSVYISAKTFSPAGEIIDPSPSDVFFTKMFIRNVATGEFLSTDTGTGRAWVVSPVDLFSELTPAVDDSDTVMYRGVLTAFPTGGAMCEVMLVGFHYRLPAPLTEINDGCYCSELVDVA